MLLPWRRASFKARPCDIIIHLDLANVIDNVLVPQVKRGEEVDSGACHSKNVLLTILLGKFG